MKLQGDEYLDFWRKRMAKGPLEAGFVGMNEKELEKQANEFMHEIHNLALRMDTDPKTVAEFGVGYGRMAARMIEVWPMMEFTGFDISPEALEKCREQSDVEEWEANFHVARAIGIEWNESFDLIYTCTCLQHITDDDMFHRALISLMTSTKPGGYVLMFENIMDAPESRHVRGYGPIDFTKPFTFAGWIWVGSSNIVDVRGEPHRGFLLQKPRA